MIITGSQIKDIRIPTSKNHHGSDAMHPDPDYSCCYVILITNAGLRGYGMTFTLGRGTEIVLCAVKALLEKVIGQDANHIFNNFSAFQRELTCDTQLRWNSVKPDLNIIPSRCPELLNSAKGLTLYQKYVTRSDHGPDKGVMHLACAAILNALWDLWARMEHKPVWKLLCDMHPQLLISTIDFRYITDVITPEEALNMLTKCSEGKESREKYIKESGYPAYTTQVGWLGFSDEKVKTLCQKYLRLGFTGYKIKVGANLQDDKRRCEIVRKEIGHKNYLMVDANQRWDVAQAIDWVTQLKDYNLLWIEEPTSPDDVLGHATISKALKSLKIGVATGEMCSNKVMFKQMLQNGGMQFCQIDSCRVASINEILAIYLMAYKLQVPVCPHAGGIGLCQMVQHLQIFDYVCLSGRVREGQFIEHVDDEHHHFTTKLRVRDGKYFPPMEPGYSTRLKDECIMEYEYPCGSQWANTKDAE